MYLGNAGSGSRDDAPGGPPRDGIYYGWYIVMVAFLGNFMATGTGFYVFNAFMGPLCEQRGWTRTAVNVAPVIGSAVGLLATLLYGTLVTRVGPRVLMFAGSLVAGSAFASLGMVTRPAHFYLLFAVLSLGNGAMSGIVANTAVSNWFEKKRGKAMGLATAGVSLSGAVMPALALTILEYYDLSSAFLGIGAMCVAVAPAALAVRDMPERYGLFPDNATPHKSENRAALHEQEAWPPSPGWPAIVRLGSAPLFSHRPSVWSPSEVFRAPSFWKVGISYALVMTGVVGVMFQLAPRLTDLGFDKKTAIAMLSATALVGAAGKAAWGALCDRFEPKRVLSAVMALNGLGLLTAFQQGSPLFLGLFIVSLQPSCSP